MLIFKNTVHIKIHFSFEFSIFSFFLDGRKRNEGAASSLHRFEAQSHRYDEPQKDGIIFSFVAQLLFDRQYEKRVPMCSALAALPSQDLEE